MSMKFKLIEPDKLMWPGKYGIVCLEAEGDVIGVANWERIVSARSPRFVMVPSGFKNIRPSCIFSSECDLGRVELVYQHGYVWPLNPPAAGRAIMEEVVRELSEE